jgi:hypothetical protein
MRRSWRTRCRVFAAQRFSPPSTDEQVAARSRFRLALQKMDGLASASAANPALQSDYENAVAEVAEAEAALKMPKENTP